MEGHTLIYVIFILTYLYFIARVIDRYNGLIKKRNKIKKPNDQKKESKNQWMHQVRAAQHEMKKLFKRSMLQLLIIPLAEICCHLIVGHYFLNGQLLSLGFFLLFSVILALTLVIMRIRGNVLFQRKFNWDLMEQKLNSDSRSFWCLVWSKALISLLFHLLCRWGFHLYPVYSCCCVGSLRKLRQFYVVAHV